jgi:hypothetical protein
MRASIIALLNGKIGGAYPFDDLVDDCAERDGRTGLRQPLASECAHYRGVTGGIGRKRGIGMTGCDRNALGRLAQTNLIECVNLGGGWPNKKQSRAQGQIPKKGKNAMVTLSLIAALVAYLLLIAYTTSSTMPR